MYLHFDSISNIIIKIFENRPLCISYKEVSDSIQLRFKVAHKSIQKLQYDILSLVYKIGLAFSPEILRAPPYNHQLW